MQITCPNCSAHYNVKIGKFGAFRRRVKCTKCSNVWEVLPAQVLGINRKKVSDKPVITTPIDNDANRANGYATSNARVNPASHNTLSISSFPAGYFIKQNFLVIAAIFTIIWSLYIQRNDLAEKFPISKLIFNSLGVSTNVVGYDFKDIIITRDLVDSQLVLTVRGKIVNVSRIPRAVPLVRIDLLDEDRQSIYYWTTIPNSENLYPEGKTDFVTKLASPPLETAEVRVKFLTDK